MYHLTSAQPSAPAQVQIPCDHHITGRCIAVVKERFVQSSLSMQPAACRCACLELTYFEKGVQVAPSGRQAQGIEVVGLKLLIPPSPTAGSNQFKMGHKGCNPAKENDSCMSL